jgi:proline racemase
VRAECSDGKCLSITLRNAPAFAERLDADIEVEGLGTIKVDIAYGGMFYAIVDAPALGFSVTPDEARELAVAGEKVRRAAREQLDVVHPQFDNVRGVSIVQFAMPFQGPGKVTRNTCIVSPGRSDRSPTGTGTSARMAVLQARGQMKEGEVLIHESIIGSRFTGKILELTEVAGRKAIVPQITGRAWITGEHHYYLDPTDPYPQGYVLSDTWGTSTSVTQ